MRSTRSLIGVLGCSAVIPLAVAALISPVPRVQQNRARIVRAQNPADEDFDVGSLLCADRSLKDPNFAQAVILIVKYDEEGTLGLILNRQSEVPISNLLDDWKEAKGHKEPMFVGGPVEKGSLLALLRSRQKSENSRAILREVRLISDRGAMQKTLQSSPGPENFRLYAGYAGWAPDQLEEEVDVGAWHIFPGDANIVFDADPDSLWMRMIKKSETEIAGIGSHVASSRQGHAVTAGDGT
jgi:putative transcriptional regulator